VAKDVHHETTELTGEIFNVESEGKLIDIVIVCVLIEPFQETNELLIAV